MAIQDRTISSANDLIGEGEEEEVKIDEEEFKVGAKSQQRKITK